MVTHMVRQDDQVTADFLGVGTTAEVPEGSVRAFDVAGRRVAVARVDGTWYAFDDACTHQGCSLAEGELDGLSIVCPCHLGEFDVATGAVLAGPPPAPIATHEVRVVGTAIQVRARRGASGDAGGMLPGACARRHLRAGSSTGAAPTSAA